MFRKFATLSNLFHWFAQSQPRPSQSQKRKIPLELETMEDRLAPVVGAFSVPPVLSPSDGFGGVVHISSSEGDCSGALLSTGRHILTAASCLTNDMGQVVTDNVTVRFDMPSKDIFVTLPRQNIHIHPSWNGDLERGHDIAVLELPTVAPVDAERFDLYRSANEPGQLFQIVGYGMTGNGFTGADIDDGLKRQGTNEFNGIVGHRLRFKFDYHKGVDEVFIAPGDMGGPNLIGNRIAGVNSYVEETDWFSSVPEYEFGEDGFSTRVSSYAGWIDSITQGRYDLVLDSNSQQYGNDGRSDRIEIYDSNNTLRVYLNGSPLHKDNLDNIRSIILRGSSDNDSIRYYMSTGNTRLTIDGRGGADSYSLYAPNTRDYIRVSSSRVSVSNNASNANLSNIETILVHGNGGDDTIDISTVNSGVKVYAYGDRGEDYIRVGNYLSLVRGIVEVNGGTNYGEVPETDRLTVNDLHVSSGGSYTISSNRITASSSNSMDLRYTNMEEVMLNTGHGNDTITLSNTSHLVVTMVQSSYGNDILNGDDSNNVLVGGAGDDVIHGNGGRDLLIGGDGADAIDGGAGEDIVIGGRTFYDFHLDALLHIFSEWLRSDRTYEQRVSNLRNGGGLNENYRLNSSTVHEDNASDRLTGGADLDWFWGNYRREPISTFFPPSGVADHFTDYSPFVIQFPGAPSTIEYLN